MRITNLRCVVYEGECDYDGPYYGDRQVRPTDIYPAFRAREWGAEDNLPRESSPGRLAITGRFLYVDTDEGVSGLFGPIGLAPALLALQMRSLILGLDPLATTMIWDVLLPCGDPWPQRHPHDGDLGHRLCAVGPEG